MALITITGYPCSGKSGLVTQLVFELNKLIPSSRFTDIHVVSDESLRLPRSTYDSSAQEKPARAAIFSACQRLTSPSTIVILDSLNYIKGFRYQIYCAARELKLRVCTIYVVATPEICRQRNNSISPQFRYSDSTLDNLIDRYEEPSSMVRWDSPLFTVPWDETLPLSNIWQAITEANVKPPNAGTLAADKAPTDALNILESTSSHIVRLLIGDPNFSYGGTLILSPSPKYQLTIILPPRSPTLAELQRLKRQFVNIQKKAITLGTTERGTVNWNEQNVANRFVEYLQEYFGTSQ